MKSPAYCRRGMTAAAAAIIAIMIIASGMCAAAPAWAAPSCNETHEGGTGTEPTYELSADCTLRIGAGTMVGHDAWTDGLRYMGTKATSIILTDPAATRTPADSTELFAYPSVTSVSGLGGIDVSGTSVFDRMLGLPSLSSPVDLSGWKTTSATSMDGMLSGMYLKGGRGDDISMFKGIGSFHTEGVTTMHGMFAGARHSGAAPAISGWDVSHVTDFSDMFRKAALPADGIDLTGWDTGSARDMSGMFGYATGGDVSGLQGFDTSHVTDLSGMFIGAERSSRADISGWDTSSATTMRTMFQQADMDGFDISGFDVSHVTDFGRMFNAAKAGRDVELGAWRTTSARDMEGMFMASTGVDRFRGLGSFHVSEVKTFASMFSSTSGVLSFDMSGWDMSAATSVSHMFSGATLGTGMSSLGAAGATMGHVTDLSGMFLSGKGTAGTVIDLSGWDTGSATDMSRMFQSSQISMFSGFEGLDTGSVSRFDYMFSWAPKSTRGADLSRWDTHSATTMEAMFVSADMTPFEGIGAWDVSGVKTMNSMFQGATFTRPIDLSGWRANSCEDMYAMFSNVKTMGMVLGVGSFRTGSVKNMAYVFNGSAGGPGIDLSGWDTSNVRSMAGMFGFVSLPVSGVGGWHTGSVTDMSNMFFSPDVLHADIDMSAWDTSNVTSMRGMFSGADLGKGTVRGFESFDVSSVTTFENMFSNAKIGPLDLSAWNMRASGVRYTGMLYSPYITSIRTGHGTRFDPDAFTRESWGHRDSLWDDPFLPGEFKTQGTWSRIPEDRSDPAGYWTTSGKRLEADAQFAARASSDHPGTYTMTIGRFVTYHGELPDGTMADGVPAAQMLTWPVSPTSDIISSAIPTSRDWRFVGWDYSRTSTSPSVMPGDPITHTVMASGDLHAIWSRIMRGVEFDGDGATGGMPATGTVPSGDGFLIPRETPVRPGFTFVGWYETDDPSRIYRPGDHTRPVSADMRLRAMWRRDPSSLPDAAGRTWRWVAAMAAALMAIILACMAIIRRRRGAARSS